VTTPLFDLLPALHRVSDAQAGHALEQLTAVLQEEVDRLQLDVEGLYDNWFIETCDDWVVPYLGDLVGVRGLGDPNAAALGQRGLVANALARRRRKGTVAVLEQLATDATGWSAKAVEFFSLLGWTQQVNHIRPGAGGTANIRDGERLELTGGPFDPLAHTADMRHIDNGRGRYGIPNVGVFLWRLQAYPIQRGTPFRPTPFDGRYWFDPLGRDIRLFNRPRGEEDIDHLAEELNVEGPLRARALRKELRAGVPATVADDDGMPRFLSPADPVFAVTIDQVRVPPAQLEICDLEDPTRRAPAGKTVAVDPHRGRLVLAPGAPEPASIEVAYAYGFPGDLGGGPYDRRASVVPEIRAAIDALQPAQVFQRGVSRTAGTDLVATPAAAITDWSNASPDPPVAVIALTDSRTFTGNLTIAVPAGCRLIIAAGDWPADAAGARRPGRVEARDVRPVIDGSITVTGVAGAPPGQLVLDGVLVSGAITVGPGSLGRLRVAHCTASALTVQAGASEADRNLNLDVDIERCVLGPVSVTPHADSVRLRDTIVHANGGAALTVGDADVDRCTVVGTTACRTLAASESIFGGHVEVERRQEGCVRFCSLPASSRVPRRFRCTAAAPDFTSTDRGHHAFGQLAATCPVAIRRGAEDGGEMGALHFLLEAQRVASLRARIDEHLRFGLEAGVFFVT
jgi:hypothetical protein